MLDLHMKVMFLTPTPLSWDRCQAPKNFFCYESHELYKSAQKSNAPVSTSMEGGILVKFQTIM